VFIAAQYGHFQVVAELIRLQVDFSLPFISTKEDLQKFAASHTKEISERMDQFILNQHATSESQSLISLTPYGIARIMGHEEIVQLLLPYKKDDDKLINTTGLSSNGFFSTNLPAESSSTTSVLGFK
jgi:hypothetical protein